MSDCPNCKGSEYTDSGECKICGSSEKGGLGYLYPEETKVAYDTLKWSLILLIAAIGIFTAAFAYLFLTGGP